MEETKYTTKTLKLPNCTVIIQRPILTEEERKKAEERVIQALSQYGKG
jgi:hypothetical protein